MRWKWLILIFALALLGAHAVSAREIVRGEDCVIGADQTIEGNVFVLCRTLVLDGTVNGNVFGAAFAVEINGRVAGDLYMLAGQTDIRGYIGRDLLFAGPVLRVHPNAVFGDVRGDLISLGLSTEVFSGARIPGSITSLSYQLLMGGEVGREISFWGSALRVDGAVAGDVDAAVGDPEVSNVSQLQTLLVPFRFDVELIPPGLLVTENATVGGQLTYTSTSPGQIEADLEQAPVFNQIINLPDFSQINDLDEDSNATWFVAYLIVAAREFITLSIIGLIAIYGLPRALQAPVQHIRSRPLNSLGAGILTFILSIGLWVVVLLMIVLAILLFAALRLGDLIVVGLMLLGIFNVGGASAFYFVAIYISRVIVGLTAGRLLVRVALGDEGTARMVYVHLLVGIGLLSLLIFLPVVGSILNALALALGLGAIMLAITQQRGLPQRQIVPVRLPAAPEDARKIPPPIVTEEPRRPGMDNLPAGFRWWDND
jgi:cytoskeletal protein CcmA (bactofilin family)